MNPQHPTGVRTAGRAFRNQFFVVCRGETVGEAMERHYRTSGVGPLILMRDYNAVPAGFRPRHSRAA